MEASTSQPATQPGDPAGATVGTPADARDAEVADESRKGSAPKNPVIVRTRWPVDLFEHSVRGAPMITAEGVEVSKSHVKALREAAQGAGTDIVVEGE